MTRPASLAPPSPVTRLCGICGGPAAFGYGVALRAGRDGIWRCGLHRLPDDLAEVEAVQRAMQALARDGPKLAMPAKQGKLI